MPPQHYEILQTAIQPGPQQQQIHQHQTHGQQQTTASADCAQYATQTNCFW